MAGKRPDYKQQHVAARKLKKTSKYAYLFAPCCWGWQITQRCCAQKSFRLYYGIFSSEWWRAIHQQVPFLYHCAGHLLGVPAPLRPVYAKDAVLAYYCRHF